MREEAVLTEYVIDAHTNTRKGGGGGGARRGEDRRCVTRKETQGHISFLRSLAIPNSIQVHKINRM